MGLWSGFLNNEPFVVSATDVALILGATLALAFIYGAVSAVYNIYFHPLSHIPGPRLAACSQIPYVRRIVNGDIVSWLCGLHELYGDAVRVSPNEVSFISGETAWQEIYGFRTGRSKTGPFLKDRTWFTVQPNGVYSIIAADEADHARFRRNYAHAFSDKALKEQESLVQGYVDFLIHRLREQVEEQRPVVDLTRWFNYTTFDIIADLTFGEPLYCLRDKEYHPWVNLVFQSVKAIGIQASIRKYSLLEKFSKKLIPKETIRKRREFFSLVQLKVATRLDNGTTRPDFMSNILKNMPAGEKGMTREEIDATSTLLLIAGSETTATLLSGATYLLLKHPKAMARLTSEVRNRFTSASEITLEAVNQMEFLSACLQEALRYYPPIPTGFPRVVPEGGCVISGKYIPVGTSVYVSQHATNHSKRNFTAPDSYIPERWMNDSRFEQDNRAAMQPFSFGPRNCLGRNLAYAEMRLIIAKLLFSFDLELVNKETDWFDQKVFTLWEKPSLMVRLVPVERRNGDASS